MRTWEMYLTWRKKLSGAHPQPQEECRCCGKCGNSVYDDEERKNWRP
jgi:hypothetical protein